MIVRVWFYGFSAVILFMPAAAFGQRTSFGFVGGTHFTRDFPVSRSYFNLPLDPGGPEIFDLYSEGNSFLRGVSFELDITRRFALEANALYRPLKLNGRLIYPDGREEVSFRNRIGTWEWPVLVKYRFSVGAVRPFVEGGPSFRTRHNPAPTEPSQFGATAGAGVEFQWGQLRFSPAVRYTRWQYDGDYPRIATKRDQVELVTGVSYSVSPSAWSVGGRKLRFGLVAGAPLTGGLERSRWPGYEFTELQGYAAGLALEWVLTDRFSVEANGLYRPFRVDQRFDLGDGRVHRDEFTVLTWQVPVLAKYSVGRGAVRPVAEAGPSFRWSGNRNGYEPSRFGLTVGGGVEAAVRQMKIGPVVRYTRWRGDEGWSKTAPNQVEVLVRLTF